MIYAAEARQQIADLREHYERLQRPDAIAALLQALLEAELTIERQPEAGLPAPRPYPSLARPGQAWIKRGRYWMAYACTKPPIILAVFYDTADIPRRRPASSSTGAARTEPPTPSPPRSTPR